MAVSFNKLETMIARQKRVRQLLAVVKIMETEWCVTSACTIFP